MTFGAAKFNEHLATEPELTRLPAFRPDVGQNRQVRRGGFVAVQRGEPDRQTRLSFISRDGGTRTGASEGETTQQRGRPRALPTRTNRFAHTAPANHTVCSKSFSIRG